MNKATFYGSSPQDSPAPSAQNPGSCEINPTDGMYVAMNSADYNRSLCGQCVKVTYGGKSVVALYADECPTCRSGGVDLGIDVFSALVGGRSKAVSMGQMKVSWSIVPCSSKAPASKKKSTPKP